MEDKKHPSATKQIEGLFFEEIASTLLINNFSITQTTITNAHWLTKRVVDLTRLLLVSRFSSKIPRILKFIKHDLFLNKPVKKWQHKLHIAITSRHNNLIIN